MRKFNENRKNMYEDESIKLIGQIIKGKTVGVVGTGKIGIRVIELFKAFGANIMAIRSRSEKDEVKNLVQSMIALRALKNYSYCYNSSVL